VAERGAARYYYVEQDHCVGSTPLDSLRTSYANVRKLTAGVG
jgi:hypothetical protein